MFVSTFVKALNKIHIEDFIGVPDSTLKPFSDYLYENLDNEHHMIPVNEGAAVALGAGMYLAKQQPVCIYMQNSGLGNAINPIASLIHEKVYDIPMLFVIGFRGEPGTKDEPQHRFQGEITLPTLALLGISYQVIDQNTTEEQFMQILQQANQQLSNQKQFAIVVKKNTFQKETTNHYQNPYQLNREKAIQLILKEIKDQPIVSTTGKISRELYETLHHLYGTHQNAFLTVGSMGHANMIALGLAKKMPNQTIYCIDGDGAILMHMGSLVMIANQAVSNYIHITLNNQAHESVGGMPTSCSKISLSDIAKACGYKHYASVSTEEELKTTLQYFQTLNGPNYIEVKVALGSRDDLGRPKESAIENKLQFINYLKERMES